MECQTAQSSGLERRGDSEIRLLHLNISSFDRKLALDTPKHVKSEKVNNATIVMKVKERCIKMAGVKRLRKVSKGAQDEKSRSALFKEI